MKTLQFSNRDIDILQCLWRGHDWRDNKYVGIPDFCGKVCMCCGEKRPNKSLNADPKRRGDNLDAN